MATNLYFEVKADFLTVPLDAKVFKTEKTIMLLVEPQEVAATEGIDLNALVAKLSDDTSVISNAFDGKTEGVKLKLSTVYLRYLQAVGDNKPASHLEYALKVDVVDIDKLAIFEKIGDMINVKEVSLAVWNTDDEAVINKMGFNIPAIPDL